MSTKHWIILLMVLSACASGKKPKTSVPESKPLGKTVVKSVIAKHNNPQPGKKYDITTFGAFKNDNLSDTKSIQSAIDEAFANDGGTVIIPAGTYISGTITLRSKVTISLDKDAIWLGSTHLSDYPILPISRETYHARFIPRSLIYADAETNVSIVGKGTIDGRGGTSEFAAQSGQKVPLSRPRVLLFVACKGVIINGPTLRNSGYWMQHYLDCDNVEIRNQTVYNHCNKNNDGLDIDGCRNVTIRNCTIDADDDALCFKATGPYHNENITVKNCIFASNCNAIKMGTETTGNFRNILISNCVVNKSDTASDIYKRQSGLGGIALEIVDGGIMENIDVRNISLTGIETPIFIRLGNRARKYSENTQQPGYGTLRNIKITGISATDTRPICSSITGIPDHLVENIEVSNCTFTLTGGGTADDVIKPVDEKLDSYPESKMFGKLPSYGIYMRHIKGISMRNITFILKGTDERPSFVLDDVKTAKFQHCDLGNGNSPDDIIVKNCNDITFSRLSRGAGRPLNITSINSTAILTDKGVMVVSE